MIGDGLARAHRASPAHGRGNSPAPRPWRQGIMAAALGLVGFLVLSPAQAADQRAGVLNFDPGTSMEDIEARLAKICAGFDTITIVSGPEPALDPNQQQVQFKCTKD
ncbi:hypothetical protein [Roseovarius sp. MMSF_3281]|uniref:hypothetical protein n=1 Tax=Roseovarius sp. MMSF_3281 TaxID=3046694 RepID=UPI00273F101E|nr:hypothetical protein [Roseovarius sp. MMSF_3281]